MEVYITEEQRIIMIALCKEAIEVYTAVRENFDMNVYKGIYNYHGSTTTLYRHAKSTKHAHTLFVNIVAEQCKISRGVLVGYFQKNPLGYKIEEVKNVR